MCEDSCVAWCVGWAALVSFLSLCAVALLLKHSTIRDDKDYNNAADASDEGADDDRHSNRH